MSFKNLLDETCTIKRASFNKSNSSRFYTDLYSDDVIGTFPCRFSRRLPGYSSKNKMITVQGEFRCYMSADIDVVEGDLLECRGINYTVIFVYKPSNHHLEVELIEVPKNV